MAVGVFKQSYDLCEVKGIDAMSLEMGQGERIGFPLVIARIGRF